MSPIKPPPPAYIRVTLTMTFSAICCLCPLTLSAQEPRGCPETLLTQSPPAAITEKGAVNVIAVLQITVTDNDRVVSRTRSTELPEELSVQGNYPNPFRTATRIVLNLPEHAQVYAEVFDLLGRVVHTSQTKRMDAGWDRTLSLDLYHTSPGV